MLESFRDEIPNFKKLVASIKKWLDDPSIDLEEIRENMYEHIVEERRVNLEADTEEIHDEAMSAAFNAIDDLIDELEVNKLNYQRLKNYIKGFKSYNAYNRLIQDFSQFMSEEERCALINEGKRIFVKELTEHWR